LFLVKKRILSEVAGVAFSNRFATDNVVAELAGLFQNQYAEFLIAGFVGELLELDGSTQTRRTSSNNDYIDLIHLSLVC
jgi:hypothetical protein